MAAPPTNVRGTVRPVNPASGGHYIPVPGGFQLIHAVGPGKWAAGPRTTPLPQAKPAAKPAAAANPFNNPLYQPSATLSGKPLAQAATALTNVEYNPTISAYQQQLNQNALHTTGVQNRAADAYKQLAQFAQDSANNVTGVEQGLGTQLGQVGQQTQAAFDQFAQKQATPALANLAAQGLGGGATDQLAANIANAKLTAAQQSGANQAFAANVGAQQQELAGKQPGIFATAGQQQLGKIATAGLLAAQPIQQKLADTQSLKSAKFAKNLAALRQQQISNSVTEAGLNIKTAAAATAATTAANNAANAATKTRTAAQQQAFNNDPTKVGSLAWSRAQNVDKSGWANDPNAIGSAAWARVQAANRAAAKKAGGTSKTGSGTTGGMKPMSTLENAQAGRTLGSIQAAIQAWQQGGVKNAKGVVINAHPTDAQMRQMLATKFDSNLTEAAFQLLGYGSVSQSTANLLKAEGYNPGAGWSFRGKPIKITKDYSPTNPAQNPPPLVPGGGISPLITNPFAGSSVPASLRP